LALGDFIGIQLEGSLVVYGIDLNELPTGFGGRGKLEYGLEWE
jgi:hypothetical protein